MGVRLRDRDPIYQCWRVAAIYRCVLRYGKNRDWALRHLRELDPAGRKDHLVEIWFMGIGLIGRPRRDPDEAAEALPLAA
jgi:hypothetical protein